MFKIFWLQVGTNCMWSLLQNPRGGMYQSQLVYQTLFYRLHRSQRSSVSFGLDFSEVVSEPNWLQKGQKRIWTSDTEDDTGGLTVVNANFTGEEHLAGSRASANTELASYSRIVSQVTHKTIRNITQ